MTARFRREATISATLGHPNIIRIFALGHTSADAPYMAMELLEGDDLATILNNEGPLAIHRVTRLTAQLTSALTAAHRAGIIHRDLKPSNCSTLT